MSLDGYYPYKNVYALGNSKWHLDKTDNLLFDNISVIKSEN